MSPDTVEHVLREPGVADFIAPAHSSTTTSQSSPQYQSEGAASAQKQGAYAMGGRKWTKTSSSLIAVAIMLTGVSILAGVLGTRWNMPDQGLAFALAFVAILGAFVAACSAVCIAQMRRLTSVLYMEVRRLAHQVDQLKQNPRFISDEVASSVSVEGDKRHNYASTGSVVEALDLVGIIGRSDQSVIEPYATDPYVSEAHASDGVEALSANDTDNTNDVDSDTGASTAETDMSDVIDVESDDTVGADDYQVGDERDDSNDVTLAVSGTSVEYITSADGTGEVEHVSSDDETQSDEAEVAEGDNASADSSARDDVVSDSQNQAELAEASIPTEQSADKQSKSASESDENYAVVSDDDTPTDQADMRVAGTVFPPQPANSQHNTAEDAQRSREIMREVVASIKARRVEYLALPIVSRFRNQAEFEVCSWRLFNQQGEEIPLEMFESSAVAQDIIPTLDNILTVKVAGALRGLDPYQDGTGDASTPGMIISVCNATLLSAVKMRSMVDALGKRSKLGQKIYCELSMNALYDQSGHGREAIDLIAGAGLGASIRCRLGDTIDIDLLKNSGVSLCRVPASEIDRLMIVGEAESVASSISAEDDPLGVSETLAANGISLVAYDIMSGDEMVLVQNAGVDLVCGAFIDQPYELSATEVIRRARKGSAA